MLTKLEFINRFSLAEITMIFTASEQSPALKAFLFKLQIAESVDTSAQDTIFGVNYLETAGLLAQGRAAEILGQAGIASPIAGRYRVLAPFNDTFPLDYAVIDVVTGADGSTTYILEGDAGGFDPAYLELVA